MKIETLLFFALLPMQFSTARAAQSDFEQPKTQLPYTVVVYGRPETLTIQGEKTPNLFLTIRNSEIEDVKKLAEAGYRPIGVQHPERGEFQGVEKIFSQPFEISYLFIDLSKKSPQEMLELGLKTKVDLQFPYTEFTLSGKKGVDEVLPQIQIWTSDNAKHQAELLYTINGVTEDMEDKAIEVIEKSETKRLRSYGVSAPGINSDKENELSI